jgi:hypothetical protein
MEIHETLPAGTELEMAAYAASDGCLSGCAGSDGSRPARLVEGTPGSTLTLDYDSTGDSADDIVFLDANGVEVSPPTSGTAPVVRRLRFVPSGTLAANPFGPPYPSFEIRFRVRLN